MRKRSYKVLSFVIVFVILFLFGANNVQASKIYTASYPSDYRHWNQGDSAYSEMREVGCFIVAQSKMLYEAGVNRSQMNPDFWYEWLWANGCLKNPPSDLSMVNAGGAASYAESQGFTATYWSGWDASYDQIWFNINAGYYTICNVGGHYVMVDNQSSLNTNEIRIYDSYNPSYAWWNEDSRCKLSRYSLKEIHVYNIKSKAPVIPDGNEMTSGYSRTIPDGDYLIANAGEKQKKGYLYLDIDGTARPAATESNVMLSGVYTGALSGIDYEIWNVKYNSDGFYTITQKDTNMALDVYGASKKAGANVSVHESNNSAAQKWAVSYNSRNGYRLQAKCNGFSLDTGSISNGSNVYTYPGHDMDNQSWLFIPYKPTQTLDEGRYVILSSVDQTKEVDLPGDTGILDDGAQISIWSDGASSRYNSYDITKLSDGYYKIKHVASGKCLEIRGGSSSRQNISIYTDNGTIAQQWAITKDDKNGGYTLRSKVSGMAMDLTGAATTNGTQIMQYAVNGTIAQSWVFVPAEYNIKYDCNGGELSDGTDTLTGKKYYKEKYEITSSTPTKDGYDFMGWSEDATAIKATYKSGDYYTDDKDVVLYAVWKVEEPNGHNYEVVEGTAVAAMCLEDGKEADQKCSICGDVIVGKTIKATGHDWGAWVVTRESTDTEKGEQKRTCKNDTTHVETAEMPIKKFDGYYYCDTLPSYVNNDEYKIEYRNNYEIIQKDSPGDGWERVATVKNEWQNSGDVYTSESDLATSDSRVLVKSVYYHFCGPNAGDAGNYAQTGNFVHYDELEIGKFGLNVVSTGNDEGHTYYLLDWSDGGGRVRCKSGVSCDGSYGTHGERCQVWYKMNYYQNRVKVEQYKYTKSSGWVSESDSAAQSVEIRFKEKSGTDISDAPSEYTPDDLNTDGTVNSTDVILLRRYIAGGYNVTINEKAADVNADGTINSTDVILIRRYIAGGYGVVLK